MSELAKQLGLAPIPATQRALTRSGLALADIRADEKMLNPNGGVIALGDPLGASGSRLRTALVHHMGGSGIRYGWQTMCEGDDQANATILESI